MRYLNEFTEAPKEREVIVVGKMANVYFRENIQKSKDSDGNDIWTAVEYCAQVVNTPSFAITDDLISRIKEKDEAAAAKAVRERRNILLKESDCEVLPDRLTKSSNAFKAWSEYRQALRDITKQEGFPWDIRFPKPPVL